MAAERGQAQLELIAGGPLLIAAALIAAQLLAIGYAQTLADGAAEAGAIAVADGRDPVDAARAALPGWAGDDVEIEVDGGRIDVAVDPPRLMPLPTSVTSIAASAWARPDGSVP